MPGFVFLFGGCGRCGLWAVLGCARLPGSGSPRAPQLSALGREAPSRPQAPPPGPPQREVQFFAGMVAWSLVALVLVVLPWWLRALRTPRSSPFFSSCRWLGSERLRPRQHKGAPSRPSRPARRPRRPGAVSTTWAVGSSCAVRRRWRTGQSWNGWASAPS